MPRPTEARDVFWLTMRSALDWNMAATALLVTVSEKWCNPLLVDVLQPKQKEVQNGFFHRTISYQFKLRIT